VITQCAVAATYADRLLTQPIPAGFVDERATGPNATCPARQNHDIPAVARIPLESRTAEELRALAERLRVTADASTQSMQVWTELLALAAYCDNLANRVAEA